LRLNIYPDGGVSRLRVHGSVTRAGATKRRVERLDALLAEEAVAELKACCGSTAWAEKMVASRPFGSMESLLARADAVWESLGESDWLEAFRAHPKIGEKKAEKDTGASAKKWATQEQAGVAKASEATLAALAEGNKEYEAKFGHIFLICATGKSADEMLAALRARLHSSKDTELAVAGEEQRKITRIRLEKMVTQ
jgi:allantoicase